jgi:putative membrane protein
MMMHGYGGMGPGMIWYWIFGSVILILLVWYIVRSFGQNLTERQHRSALDILKERHARGEIDDNEFKKMKNHLNS